jgi:predicted nuclease with TOPRIM domain
MHERLQTRLGELKKEFEKGRACLQELEKEQTHLRQTMLRISGAIHVLEELLADGGSFEQNAAHLSENQPFFWPTESRQHPGPCAPDAKPGR